MAVVTAPNIEVTRVVTGNMYELSIAEEESGTGITRIDIGPYYFNGVPPTVSYPEAVTNEMTPPGWQAIRWITDSDGSSWLRYQGGILNYEDGEQLFQFTSNFSASDTSGPHLTVWRGSRSESYDIPVPDYTNSPPLRNSRHDSQGLGRVYRQSGCVPQVVLTGVLVVGIILHLIK